ncbi:uncharacterized protein LOC128190809 [Crassostrea angulata]|uniref:uncharacterized protein LOC128190809 n=1 Tax=Magallana angulata TaxID=2784310 RepID=UPI0022B19940|nr:uncharacterized protein LOC128190809 [Crassostrea angulata]
MVAIEQCSNTSEERTSRSNINKCPTLENYHCLKTEDGQLRELCTSPIWIEAGKCPIFSATGKLDARICQSISSGTCPPKVFKSNLNFNYPGCLPSYRAESTTTNIHGKYQTTQNSNFTVSASDEGGSSLVVAIVVPLLVLVIIVTIGIAWWIKKKEIRKWIRDIGDVHFMISMYNLFELTIT